MSSNTRELLANSTHLNASRKLYSTIQSSSRSASRETLEDGLTSGTNKPSRLEAKSRVKADDRRSDPQEVQKMLKFRTSILALDPHAKFFVGGHPLMVIHSKCGGKSVQKATNDASNFREHVSICQGPPFSAHDNGSLKSSLQGGLASSIYPTVLAPAGPSQPPCLGFNFEKLFGKDYKSLLNNEREQVTRAAKVAGLVWLNSNDKSSVISTSCLKKSPSRQEPAQPCHNCSKVLELSNFKDTLRREPPKLSIERYTPFRSADTTVISAGEYQKAMNGKV
ncbi:hypothetical protein BDM02DRAFT_3266131 [Thelephora ganbajun]|uniref:Uncharacterized protein n=1 Tax=Thelephora ganbajun TaxID=370292 RepID=A0ACB6ZTB3_THEGA|nr:hypothetical protein BDM02DRAFT_3266131 [Thelephora ganbajun]